VVKPNYSDNLGLIEDCNGTDTDDSLACLALRCQNRREGYSFNCHCKENRADHTHAYKQTDFFFRGERLVFV